MLVQSAVCPRNRPPPLSQHPTNDVSLVTASIYGSTRLKLMTTDAPPVAAGAKYESPADPAGSGMNTSCSHVTGTVNAAFPSPPFTLSTLRLSMGRMKACTVLPVVQLSSGTIGNG